MFPIRDNIPTTSVPFINYLIIVLCIAVFALQLTRVDDREGRDLLAEEYGMIPQRVLHPHAVIRVPEERPVQTPYGVMVERVEHPVAPAPINPWLTLLTCIFLHGSWLHIIGNMWFLFIFGDNVEDSFGHVKYLLFYLFCGVSASVAHLIFNLSSPMPTIGASGAIAGIMGAYFVLYPRAKITAVVPIFFFLYFVAVPAPIFLGIWFVLQFLQGTTITPAQTGVAWWAHVGGFVVGAGLTLLLRSAGMVQPRSHYVEPQRGAWGSR